MKNVTTGCFLVLFYYIGLKNMEDWSLIISGGGYAHDN